MGKGIDNERYRQMKTRDGVYIPDIDIEYPVDRSDKHIFPVRYDGRQVALDRTFPYQEIGHSLKYRFNQALNHIGLRCLLIPLNRIRYGLRIEGKDKLKKYAAQLKNGALTVCNHIYPWDLTCVLDAIGWRKLWFPIFGEHMRGKDAWFMYYLGGVPIPEETSGMRAFDAVFNEMHEKKQWIHVFPEAASWRFYTPVRTFHKGAFAMAWKYDIPVFPFVISYRRRTGVYKLFDKPNIPLLTLNVGDPVFPDRSKPRKEETDRLLHEAHKQMTDMAGILENPWPETFE